MTHTPTPAHQPGMTGGSMSEQLVHWIGEHNNTLHGNGYGSRDMEHASGDEDEVTCTLCHSLLARLAREAEETAPEATDPTPGEAGLSDFPQLGSEIHRFRCTNPDCRHYSDQGYFTPRDNDAASAILASDWLAARTADLREIAAEVGKWRGRCEQHDRRRAEVGRVLDEVLGTEEADGAGEGLVADVALLADRALAAEAREAHIGSREFASTLLGEWVKPYYGDDSDDAVACLHRALRAALTTPPTTEGSK